jgi:hypothetical protein
VAPPPPASTVSVNALLEQIELASTMEGLELLRIDINRLPKGSEERKQVIEAATRRTSQIRAEEGTV